MLYNKPETKIKIMKINCSSRPIYGFVDMINRLPWFYAATSITIAGLGLLWAIGGFFISISV